MTAVALRDVAPRLLKENLESCSLATLRSLRLRVVRRHGQENQQGSAASTRSTQRTAVEMRQ